MKRGLILILVALLLPACSSDDPTAPPMTTSDFDAVMDAAGKVVPPETERHEITTTEEVRDGKRYTYEMHDAVENLENVVYLGLNDDVIWPGNMVKGTEAQSYVYIPISAPRAPITLSISLEGTGFGGSLSEEVTDPKLSTVRQGISTLVGRALDQQVSVPAQVDWSYEEVHSSSQMSMFVGADIGYGLGSLETAFDWNQGNTPAHGSWPSTLRSTSQSTWIRLRIQETCSVRTSRGKIFRGPYRPVPCRCSWPA